MSQAQPIPPLIQPLIGIQEILNELELSNIQESATKIDALFKKNVDIDELVANICYYTSIRISNIQAISELVFKLSQGFKPDFKTTLLRCVNSGLLLRFLYDKGLFSVDEIKRKITQDSRLGWFFPQECSFDAPYQRTRTAFRYIIRILERLKANNWQPYKKLIYDLYEPDSIGYAIKNDNVTLLQKFSDNELTQKVPISPFEIFNIPSQDVVETKLPLNLAAIYGSHNCFNYIVSKVNPASVVIDDTMINDIITGLNLNIFNQYVAGKSPNWPSIMKSVNEHHFTRLYHKINEVAHNLTLEETLNAKNYKLFIEVESSTKISEEEGENLLRVATKNGLLSVVKYLNIMKGVDVNCKDKNGETPLHIAVENQYTDIARYFISQRADIEAKAKGKTPICSAAEVGSEAACLLLEQSGAQIGVKTASNRNLLHLIAKSGNINLYKHFSGKISPNERDRNDYTPLLVAAGSKCLNMCQFLVGTGMVPTAVTKKNETAVFLAAQSGDAEVTKFFIDQKINPDIGDSNNVTPLHIAVQKDFYDVASLLLERNANVNARDSSGKTPIFNVRKDSEEMLKLLISKGASINIQDNAKKTPFRVFIEFNSPKLYRLLVDHNADLMLSDGTMTDLQFAESKISKVQFNKILKYLNNNTDTMSNSDAPQSQQTAPQTPKRPTVVIPHAPPQPSAPNQEGINSQNPKGATLLHIAASEGHYVGCKLLISSGADINTIDGYGRTPLHYAVINRHYDIAKLLISQRASKDIKDHYGKTVSDYINEGINGLTELTKI